MTFDPQLIAPVNSGLKNYYKPFLIERDAFTEMEDCYSQRGVVRKRDGSTLFGTLPPLVLTSITNASPPVVTSVAHGLTTGQSVSFNTIVGAFTGLATNQYNITVINANSFSLQDLYGVNVPATGAATAGNITQPVVGITTWNVPTSFNEQLVVFNQNQAFLWSGTVFINISFNPAGTAILWTGGRDNFFVFTNYANSLWVTNNVDPVRYWNGNSTTGWTDVVPDISVNPNTMVATTLTRALIIIPYKGRLVVLNTTETTAGVPTVFRQRARWTQRGTPYNLQDATHAPPSGFSAQADAWRSDVNGKGGFIDADTSEPIVSAVNINDTLIVGFQFSTWRLRYTGNEVLPFIWERIDTTFGAESTMAAIPLDNVSLNISRRGIVACSPSDVSRIDLDIPDVIEDFYPDILGQGMTRVWGIRDFDRRMVYWSFANVQTDVQPPPPTPNNLLCYNYQDNTWATFNQSFVSLGRYKNDINNTWNTWNTTWAGDNSAWNEVVDTIVQEFLMLGGDFNSNVIEIMDPEASTDLGIPYNFTLTTKLLNPYFDKGKRCRLAYADIYITADSVTNMPIASITQAFPPVVTVVGTHTLTTGSTVYISNITDMVQLNGQILTVTVLSTSTFSLNNVDATTYPAYVSTTGIASINGEISCLYYVDDNEDSPVAIRRVSTGLQGAGSTKYVRIFLNSTGIWHQFTLTLSNGTVPFLTYPPNTTADNQLGDAIKGRTPFELQGIVLHTREEGRIRSQ